MNIEELYHKYKLCPKCNAQTKRTITFLMAGASSKTFEIIYSKDEITITRPTHNNININEKVDRLIAYSGTESIIYGFNVHLYCTSAYADNHYYIVSTKDFHIQNNNDILKNINFDIFEEFLRIEKYRFILRKNMLTISSYNQPDILIDDNCQTLDYTQIEKILILQ